MAQDNSNDLPVSDVYGDGVSIPGDPTDIIYMELKKGWEPIDWEAITIEGDVLDAVTDAATQFHYIYLSQVLLLGRLIERATDDQAKRLSILLAASRMRDVDAWARYLGQLEATSPISEELRDYFRELYKDDHVSSQLIGIALADIYRYAIEKSIPDTGDPTFGRLIERDVKHAGKNLELFEAYFKEIIPELQEERPEILENIKRYRDMTEEIIMEHIESLEAIDETAGEVSEQARKEADLFYEKIGL